MWQFPAFPQAGAARESRRSVAADIRARVLRTSAQRAEDHVVELVERQIVDPQRVAVSQIDEDMIASLRGAGKLRSCIEAISGEVQCVFSNVEVQDPVRTAGWRDDECVGSRASEQRVVQSAAGYGVVACPAPYALGPIVVDLAGEGKGSIGGVGVVDLVPGDE